MPEKSETGNPQHKRTANRNKHSGNKNEMKKGLPDKKKFRQSLLVLLGWLPTAILYQSDCPAGNAAGGVPYRNNHSLILRFLEKYLHCLMR